MDFLNNIVMPITTVTISMKFTRSIWKVVVEMNKIQSNGWTRKKKRVNVCGNNPDGVGVTFQSRFMNLACEIFIYPPDWRARNTNNATKKNDDQRWRRGFINQWKEQNCWMTLILLNNRQCSKVERQKYDFANASAVHDSLHRFLLFFSSRCSSWTSEGRFPRFLFPFLTFVS